MLRSQDIERFNVLTQRQAFPEAYDFIKTLLPTNPDNIGLFFMAAKLAEKTEKLDDAATIYRQLLGNQAVKVDDVFNIALRLKAIGHYEDALNAYQNCLKAKISQPEDVYLNMGVIHSDFLFDTQFGEICFNKALEINPKLHAAYINIGNIYDETGQTTEAVSTYEQALKHSPSAHEALARLANAQTIEDPNHPIISRLQAAVKQPQSSAFELECLYFALGNIYNTLQDYSKAFESYEKANMQGQRHGRSYEPSEIETYVSSQISQYIVPQVLKRTSPSQRKERPAPIFICGMFRSGSTLIEQVVSSHPDVSAKGELDFFANLMMNTALTTDQSLPELACKLIEEVRENYLSQPGIAQLDTPFFTDKRPDNFLHIGLIKSLFPKAKILHTTRHPLDTSLSTFFTQFGDGQSYARNLNHIAHYHQHHDRLMQHWKACFPEDILTVVYDDFVKDSETIARDVISFLNLEWHPSCLNFYTRQNRVKTASFKQVRRKLYTSSSGRWKNYEPYIGDLTNTFDAE